MSGSGQHLFLLRWSGLPRNILVASFAGQEAGCGGRGICTFVFLMLDRNDPGVGEFR